MTDEELNAQYGPFPRTAMRSTSKRAPFTIADAQVQVEAWRRDYRTRRPYSSLGADSNEFVAQRQAIRDRGRRPFLKDYLSTERRHH